MLLEVGKYLYKVTDNPELNDGFYFSNESDALEGPYYTLEDAKKAMEEYCERLS